MDKYVTEPMKGYHVVDDLTGELLEYQKVKKVSIDEFIMLFFCSYPQLMTLKGMVLKVLMCCWKYSSYNAESDVDGNLIHNNASFKDRCRSEGLDTSNASIDNAISVLSSKGLLLKKCKGEYLLNPQYFFKGKLSKRSKIELDFIVEPEETEE